MVKLLEALELEFGARHTPIDMLPAPLLDATVEQVFLSTNVRCNGCTGPFADWPGGDDDIGRWFQLENGVAVGVRGALEAPNALAIWEPAPSKSVDWNRLRAFEVAAEAGSFTKAGLELGLTQSAVSRKIAALERDVGAAMFIRSARGLVLTEAGRFFLGTVKSMSRTLDLGLSRLNELRAQPWGPLRVTTTVGFGSAWLTSRIRRFQGLYPDINVSLLLADDHELDLQRSEADCAIRFDAPRTPGLTQFEIGAFDYKIYAARSYVAARGAPRSLDELAEHDLVVYGDVGPAPPIRDVNWLLTVGMPSGQRRPPALEVNSVYGVYRAVESGVGVAALPFYIIEHATELVQLLPEIEGPRIPLYFVYPQELQPSRRVQALRDFLLAQLVESDAPERAARSA